MLNDEEQLLDGDGMEIKQKFLLFGGKRFVKNWSSSVLVGVKLFLRTKSQDLGVLRFFTDALYLGMGANIECRKLLKYQYTGVSANGISIIIIPQRIAQMHTHASPESYF